MEGKDDYQPQRGDLCRINLIGRLENGTVVEELTNHLIQIGDVEVVQGLDMAIPLMRIGEKAEIVCDPRFAYGTLGLENKDDASKNIPHGAKVCQYTYIYICHIFNLCSVMMSHSYINMRIRRWFMLLRCSNQRKKPIWKQNHTLRDNRLGKLI